MAGRRALFAAASLLLFGLLSCVGGRLPTIEVRIGGEAFRLEVARSDAEKARGLMHRRSLGAREGMLFVYDADEHMSFWMKDTTIPLTLAFLSRDGQILQIAEMKPLSLKPLTSQWAARYVLELPRGTLERLGVRVGERIELPADFQ
jgi:uncharacterized membrane protein (UPF0127 family)